MTAVPVYQWALPEDLAPLEDACRALATGQVDVALFTTATQVVHLLQVAERHGRRRLGARARWDACVVASIGPTTSEELRDHGIDVDMEPSHPKMGFLVREAAERARALRAAKQASAVVARPSVSGSASPVHELRLRRSLRGPKPN